MSHKTMVRSFLAAVAALTLFLAGVGQAKADSIFDFEDVPPGTTTPFSETNGGITATFSSSADPGGFETVTTFFAPPIAGNVLLDPGPSDASSIPLDLSFSQPLSSVSLDFATDGSGPFLLSAYSGSTPVGSASVTGSVPIGYGNPQGTISFGSATFDNIVLTSPDTPYFAVDNIDVTSAVPEPSTLALLGVVAVGLIGWAWRLGFWATLPRPPCGPRMLYQCA